MPVVSLLEARGSLWELDRQQPPHHRVGRAVRRIVAWVLFLDDRQRHQPCVGGHMKVPLPCDALGHGNCSEHLPVSLRAPANPGTRRSSTRGSKYLLISTRGSKHLPIEYPRSFSQSRRSESRRRRQETALP